MALLPLLKAKGKVKEETHPRSLAALWLPLLFLLAAWKSQMASQGVCSMLG